MEEFLRTNAITITSLKKICENLIMWKNQDVFKHMEEVIGQINNVFTIILSNKSEFENYKIYIDETIIIPMLTNMLNSMENQDLILLLDTLDNEIIPELEKIQNIIKEV